MRPSSGSGRLFERPGFPLKGEDYKYTDVAEGCPELRTQSESAVHSGQSE